MDEKISQIILASIPVFAAIITGFIIPFIKEKIDQKNRDVECYAMMINVIKSRQKELEQNKRMLAKKKAQAQSSIVVLEGVKDEQLNLDVDPSLRLVKKQK